MKNPFIAPDGYTYEKDAIFHYLQENRNRSPITEQIMKQDQLYPNFALKKSIKQYAEEKGFVYDPENITSFIYCDDNDAFRRNDTNELVTMSNVHIDEYLCLWENSFQ